MSAAERNSAVHALAPAKVNAWLAVLGRRPDGYHELDTGLVALDLCDRIDVRRTDRGGVELTLSGPWASADVPVDGRNLAVAGASIALAAAVQAGAVPRSAGLSLSLDKRIPSQAGLGGGSSDAAAGLLAAERALGFALDPERAREALAALGSDCAFFREAAATGFARCTARGDRVESLPPIDPGWHFALVAPALACATADVYRALIPGLCSRGLPPSFRADVFSLDEARARTALFNQLEDAALAAFPELACWHSVLARCRASHFRLAGSGSSFFGLFRDAGQAHAAIAEIAAAARDQGLGVRGTWVARPAGHGAVTQSSL